MEQENPRRPTFLRPGRTTLELVYLAALEARMDPAGRGSEVGARPERGAGRRLLFPDARPAEAK
jgi:hypothetical protein